MRPRPVTFFAYKLMADTGGAPCVRSGLLSLAICKPAIRRAARVGDNLFGFRAKSMGMGNGLIYLARVDDVLEGGAYYRERRFATRPDCIYRADGERLRIKANAPFHWDGAMTARDVGEWPSCQNAVVLLSRTFRYFGREAVPELAAVPGALAVAEKLGRSHRREFSASERRALEELQRRVFRRYRKKVNGRPTHARVEGRVCD